MTQAALDLELAPGLHSLSAEHYAALPYVNWSTAKLLETSAKLLKYRASNPAPDSDAFALGRAIHRAILEPERWQRDYAAKPDFGDCRFKENKARRDEWTANLSPSMTVLDAASHTLAELCAGEVHTHGPAREMLTGGRAEQSIIWIDAETGLRCKARLDYLRPTDIVDLKSTRRATVRKFLVEASQLLYHGQLSFYHDGAIAAGVLPPDAELPGIVTVQTTAPHDVAAYRMTRLAYLAGRSLWQGLLRRYGECQAADWWPGIAPSVLDFEPMPWAAGMQDDVDTLDDW